jgi:dephospho-CoA kinase
MGVRLIGLTGGIGSGKSSVAAMLADRGAHVIDADRVGHEVYRPGTDGFTRVVEAFGREIVGPDGTIDRRRLGAVVFADPEALARLNAIVHPLIREELGRRVADALAADPDRVVVVEAAILMEAGWHFFERVWVVVVDPETAIDRVVASRGLSRDDVARRIDAQMSNEARRARADVVIDNGGDFEALRASVEAAWAELAS